VADAPAAVAVAATGSSSPVAPSASARFWSLASGRSTPSTPSGPEEQSVELFLGEFSSIGNPGLNFAPWPLVTAEVLAVTRENSISIGTNRPGASSDGLMLTTDENIVDIDFEVVWNISDPALFLFNLRDPEATIRAVSEASMREVISASQLAPILNRDRALIADSVKR
jgi:membrane protease subunit HflK